VKIKDVINEAGFLNRLGAGIRGAVAGVQASQARRAADPDAATRNRVRQQNFKQELTQWQNNLNMVAKQGANVKDPATFLKVLQSYVEVHYPNAQVSMDINQVAPTNPKSISDYLFAAYNSEMDSTTAIAPTASTGPAADIKDTLDPEMQYRFPNPDYPGTQIIVRNSGWYIDKLPVELRGQVRRDKTTGLYPVLQPNNIKKYNLYYNQAAENNQVREEPAAAL
jgi:hypothetical protein